MNFLEKRKQGSDIVCVCCANLFFLKSVQTWNISKVTLKLKETKLAINEYINQIVNNSSEYVCKTCIKYIKTGEIPKTVSNEDLGFTSLPKVITNLTALEERMVSPYIPFMQIKHCNRMLLTLNYHSKEV